MSLEKIESISDLLKNHQYLYVQTENSLELINLLSFDGIDWFVSDVYGLELKSKISLSKIKKIYSTKSIEKEISTNQKADYLVKF